MDVTRRRTLAITGATLALVVAGSAVAAAGGRDDRGDRGGRGFDRADHGIMRGQPWPGARGFRGFGGLGPMRGFPGIAVDGLVRSETTIDLGEAGFLTRRVDDGTVTSASDTELTYTLATGESATVTADEDTRVLALRQDDSSSDDRMFRRRMVSLDEITIAEIPVDADVIVWSEAGSSGQFVAQRVLVRPSATDAADAGSAAPEAAPSAAPEASPDI